METNAMIELPAANPEYSQDDDLKFSPVATVAVEGELVSSCGCEDHECGCSGDCGCDGD